MTSEERAELHSETMAFLSSPDVPIQGKREFMFFLFRVATLRPLFRMTDAGGYFAASMIRQFMRAMSPTGRIGQ